jgi:peptidoglycan hydrolase CwlO-like protein
MGDTRTYLSFRRQWHLFLLSSIIAVGLLFNRVLSVRAQQSCDEFACNQSTQDENAYLTCIKDKQSCLERKIDETQSQQNTLSNTISILNGQIQVQELNIQQTLAEIRVLEKEIEDLSQRIGGLDLSLDQLSRLMVRRVGEQYKRQHINPVTLVFTDKSLSNFLIDYKYLKLAREQTLDAMQRAETQRQLYNEQKTLKEDKQTQVTAKQRQLEQQQDTLEKQRAEQQYLLTDTRNNEARYQEELAKTLNELRAIQSIIAGKGTESSVGEVHEGDGIASVIAGASACSTGTHLHFEVVKDSAHRDPASYLKPIDIVWSNDPDSSFGFSGNWEWPLNNAARITQGYGMTYYARVKRAYGGAPHTGIDMISKTSGNYQVKAVKDGTLYRGSIPCGGGLLRYVKVQHKDDGISSYYLHINY